MNQIRDMGITFDNLQQDQDNSQPGGNRSYIASLKTVERLNHTVLMESVRKIPGVVYLETL